MNTFSEIPLEDSKISETNNDSPMSLDENTIDYDCTPIASKKYEPVNSQMENNRTEIHEKSNNVESTQQILDVEFKLKALQKRVQKWEKMRAQKKKAKIITTSNDLILDNTPKDNRKNIDLMRDPLQPIPIDFNQIQPVINLKTSTKKQEIQPSLKISNQMETKKIKDICEDIPHDILINPREQLELTKKKLQIPSEFNLPFFTHVVTNSEKDFTCFTAEWERQESFACSLFYTCMISTKEYKCLEEDGCVFLAKIYQVQGMAVCWDLDSVHFISLAEDESISLDLRMEKVKKVMGNPHSSKILFNLKPQLKLFKYYKIPVCGKLLDPKICAWVLKSDEHKEMTLLQLVEAYANIKTSILTKDPFEICCFNTQRTLLVMKKMLEVLEKDDKEKKLFEKIEMPLVEILAGLEYNGFGFINEKCKEDRRCIQDKLDALEQEAYRLAGKEFQLSSTTSVSEILFDHLKLPTMIKQEKGKKNNRKQQYSTDKVVLQKLSEKHPLPSVILEWRKISHLITHYLDILFKYAFYDEEKFEMYRIFSTVLQTTVPTGRLAFTDPNLQSISHDVSFVPVDEEKRPNPQSITISIRNYFVASPNHLILAADYSQLEVRLMAHFSKDPKLLAILNGGGDVFKQIATQWLEKSIEQITEDEREKAKHVCYGILYGGGPKMLSDKLRCSIDEATFLIQTFKTRYPGVTKFLSSVLDGCRKKGYVQTLLSRRRYLPDINSTDSNAKSKAERQAVNTICQGSAADLIKKAMITIHEKLKQTNSTAVLLVQIHDELLYEVEEKELASLQVLIKHSMERAVTLDVPIPVKLTVGKSWGSLQPYLV